MLGGGKMGEALLSGMLRAGPPGGRRRRHRAAPSGPGSCASATACRSSPTREAAKAADVLVLAVKPQDMAALLAELGPARPPTSW